MYLNKESTKTIMAVQGVRVKGESTNHAAAAENVMSIVLVITALGSDDYYRRSRDGDIEISNDVYLVQ